MSNYISSHDFVEVMQEAFLRGQDITFTPSGTSMLPMLIGDKDQVTLSRKPDRLNRYDVALYRRRDSGQLVLHRMIGFTKNDAYIFSGDNQYSYEYGVCDEDILARMSSFIHKGKDCRTDGFSYKMYVRRMMLKKRILHVSHSVYHALKKCLKH